MQTVSLRLPANLLAELEAEAKSRRVSKSSLVRESLEKALSKRAAAHLATCYDLSRDLVGSVTGLPKDIAENPKYMNDFGK